MDETELRREIVATCRRMNASGLNQGTSGNVGVRVPDGYLLTPSGMDYDLMAPEDIVAMDFEGRYAGRRIPSTEWRFHRDILKRRPEVDVVIHTHSMFCTTLAIHGLSFRRSTTWWPWQRNNLHCHLLIVSLLKAPGKREQTSHSGISMRMIARPAKMPRRPRDMLARPRLMLDRPRRAGHEARPFC